VNEVNELLYKLAATPLGIAVKVGVWAALGWFIINIDSFNLHPMIAVAITAGGVVLTDALNPEDGRFGKGSMYE
jgi:hypothetical protein